MVPFAVSETPFSGLVPIPIPPPMYAFPVVVAPPEMVRPPVCVPSPMVEDAFDIKPASDERALTVSVPL